VLAGHKSLEDVVWIEPSTNLTFLPSVVKTPLSNSSDILGGFATKSLFDELRLRYDYIFVDLSPIAPVVDVRATTHFVDSYVFIIEWGRTKIDVVSHALGEARGVYQNLLGVVLNKASIKELSRYEWYKKEYYSNKWLANYG
jgi:succinoglycan biosynthesis transport protein ExoP